MPATIREFVDDATAGDIVTVETKDRKYLNRQNVCERHEVQDGTIICITVGGDIPMMIVETVSDDKCAYAHTYENSEFKQIGELSEFAIEGHPKFNNYSAEGWLDITEFVQYIK